MCFHTLVRLPRHPGYVIKLRIMQFVQMKRFAEHRGQTSPISPSQQPVENIAQTNNDALYKSNCLNNVVRSDSSHAMGHRMLLSPRISLPCVFLLFLHER